MVNKKDSLISKYIGDKVFYKSLFTIMLPVLAQNVISFFVSLLDNIMVGLIGTEQMSGVAIVNQLFFVFNLCVFGGLAGAGIYTAQYYGAGDEEGVRNTIRAKIWIAASIVVVFIALFMSFGEELISLFIHEGEDDIDLVKTMEYGLQYMDIILFQMPLFAFINVYATTLRETNDTKTPMKASIVSVCVNLCLNYILIYGKFGVPVLGVRGAAIATVIARCVELSILIFEPSRKINGAWKNLKVPLDLTKKILKKGLPLMLNEVLWSTGITTLNQSISMLGIEVVSAENIASTVSDLFFCSFFATGSAISIIIGQLLGAGQMERAIDEDRKLIAFSVVFSSIFAILMVILAPVIPQIYNTTDIVRSLAKDFIIINAVLMPINAFTNSCFFTLRSGGKVLITFLYDSVYLWVLAIPLTRLLVYYSSLGAVAIYFISYAIDILKAVFGYVLVKKQTWVNNIVAADTI